jgi:hypothetical protein
LKNKLGIAIAKRTYKVYQALIASPRWQRAYNAGARPQRISGSFRCWHAYVLDASKML